jgi:hypothetical protein
MRIHRHHGFFYRMKQAKGLLFHIAGIIALFWFLFRVLPAPHRSQYPCQQLAIPIAFGYIAFWTTLISATLVWVRHFKKRTLAFAPALLIVFILLFSISGPGFAGPFSSKTIIYSVWTPDPKQPIGVPTGLNPGRVVWVWDSNATEKQLDGYWWEAHNNDQDVIESMFSKGITSLAGTNCEFEAWDLLFKYFNMEKGKGDHGYISGEKIAIKINLNNCWNPLSIIDTYKWGDNERDAHPNVVRALLDQLVDVAGIDQRDITVYDASRPMPNWFYEPVHDAFPDVQYVDCLGGAVGRELVQPSDTFFYFADGSIWTIPTCVVDAEYLINMPLLKQHPINNGITLSGKNLFGTFIEPVVSIHPYHESGQIMGNPTPQTDLFASEEIGGKTLLYIGDGLYGTLQDHRTIVWFQMYPFNDDWTNSLFFSQDPVAIDSVMYDFLHTQGPIPIEGSQNYLHQSAEPKKDTYDPENDGVFLSESLGAHEHWDVEVPIFSSDRYSGMGGNGIDFVTVGGEEATPSIVITCPEQQKFYLFGDEQIIRVLWKNFYKLPRTVVIGPLTVEAMANNVDPSQIDCVEFYLDGFLQSSDQLPPFQWMWEKPSVGTHVLKVQMVFNDGTQRLSSERIVLKIL